MRYGGGSGARAAAAVVVAVLMTGWTTGCSSEKPAQAKVWEQFYCAKLGSWQDARNAAAGAGTGDGQGAGSLASDEAASSGRSLVAAARRLDREGLGDGATRVLDDTTNAVGGDPEAERRAVSYCDDAGFETLVGSAD
ncbi:hypothetical protein [Streptomyces sp. SID4985]|uniref:hypothetical protein n=1 Tax=unclassified Streptomyces TaxID=2593676 RepID=UPI00136C0C4E|nr:hypothetical protein [Streptomyces sp. SID4985]MYQ45201.1 hypothetical protein [Streptomyces sp. SID4985]